MLKHLLRGGGSDIKGDSWVATLGGSNSDIGNSVAIGSDGSVYVCGETNNDYLLAKFNSSGTLQWQKTTGGYPSSRAVAIGSDDSVYVCGSTYIEDGRGYECLITKFNSSGTLQWQKTLGVSNSNSTGVGSIAIGSDGSVYVCGSTASEDLRYRYMLIAKYNSSGALQWQKKLGGSYYDRGNSVAVGTDGSVYFCGTSSAGAGSSDVFITKFNSSGTLQWQKTLGGSDSDSGNSVAIGSDGSVYICGNTYSAGAGGSDAFIAKFNSSGTLQWQKTLGGSNSDIGNSVAIGSDGSVYICGNTYSAGAGGSDAFITKFNSSGALQWQKTLGGSDSDSGNSVAIGSDGSVYVCGRTYSAGAGGSDILIARITDDVINQSTVIYGNFTLQDAALTVSNASLINQTASLSLANPGMSVLTPSLTVKDANLTFTKY